MRRVRTSSRGRHIRVHALVPYYMYNPRASISRRRIPGVSFRQVKGRREFIRRFGFGMPISSLNNVLSGYTDREKEVISVVILSWKYACDALLSQKFNFLIAGVVLWYTRLLRLGIS